MSSDLNIVLKSRDSNEIDPNKNKDTMPMQSLGNSTHQNQISARPSIRGENKTTAISRAHHHHPGEINLQCLFECCAIKKIDVDQSASICERLFSLFYSLATWKYRRKNLERAKNRTPFRRWHFECKRRDSVQSLEGESIRWESEANSQVGDVTHTYL